MKLLILDVDGVLNTAESRAATGLEIHTYLSWLSGPVKQLKRIIDETEAKIVIASRWRLPKYIDALHKAFDYFDLPDWIAVLPNFKHKKKKTRRGKEIREFIKEFDDVIDGYVVIDDHNFLLSNQQGHLVQPDSNVGLSPDDADKAILILNEMDNRKQ